MAKFQAPDAFNFTNPIEWPDWLQRFGRYRLATKLSKEDETVQVSALIYAMGKQGENVYKSLVFTTDGDENKYDKVVEKLNSYFIPKRNVIHERAKFHMRSQGPGESIEAFVRSLYEIAEFCEFGTKKDEQIRDRLVIGITDKTISEKLQLKADLTLETALQIARQAEQVKNQIKDQATKSVDAIHKGKKGNSGQRRHHQGQHSQNSHSQNSQSRPSRNWNSRKQNDSSTSNGPTCWNCNKRHARGSCPAYGKQCHKCKGMGHFAVCCRDKRTVYEVMYEENDPDNFFLGSITTGSMDAWKVTLPLCGSSVTLKIDTGADISVLSKTTFNKLYNKPPLVKAASSTVLQSPGGTLECIGKFTHVVRYKGKDFPLQFFVVGGKLTNNLLSRDAALSLGLVMRLEETVKFDKSVFGSSGLVNCEPVTIKLKENVTPYCLTTARRVPFPLLDKVAAELKRMESEGVIKKITEPTDWCAPMVPVLKKNGKIRICVDLKRLNEVVKREILMLPTLDDISPKLAGATVFSKLDASSGFYQIPLHEDSSKLTTFITPFGRFCFRRVPFGITSAPEIFQRKMSEILAGLEGVESIIDDTIIYGRTVKEHDERLIRVMDRIQKSGLKLNEEKCEFGKPSIEYFGHVISSKGISPNPKRVEAIRKLDAPKDVAELRRVLGMINYLGRFLPNLSDMLKPMTDLLKSDQVWAWTAAQEQAFDRVKQNLIETPTLNFYDPTLPTVVSADASSFGLGGALFQLDGNQLKPIALCSRTLTQAESKYAQIEKECLASVWACEKFERYLVGLEKFRLLTDHKPLVPLINTQDLDRTPLRCQRLLMRLRRFSVIAEHVPGKMLVVADALSRSPMASQEGNASDADVAMYVDSVDKCRPIKDRRLETLRKAQHEDIGVQRAIHYTKYGWPDRENSINADVKEYFSARNEFSVSNDLLLYRDRIVVPKTQRADILENIHEGHLGTAKCRQRAGMTVWWPGITRDINDKVSTCDFCQVHRPSQGKEPLKATPLPDRPWQRISADLCDFQGKNYLIVMDYFSRYLELIYLETTTSAHVIGKLKNIFARWGVPEVFISDNGPQFAAKEFSEFAEKYGFTHRFSSPYYPQSNGEAESGVKIAKRILAQDDVFLALMAYRSTPIASTGVSPCHLIMGRQIRTILPSVPKSLNPRWPNLKSVAKRDEHYKKQYTFHYNRRNNARPLSDLEVGQEVKLKHDHEKLWSTNGVVESADPESRSYLVRTPRGVYQRNRRHIQMTGNLCSNPVGSVPSPENDNANDKNGACIVCDPPNSPLPKKPPPLVTKCEPVPSLAPNRPKREISLPARLKDCVVTMK